jgi:hypothetical protein
MECEMCTENDKVGRAGKGSGSKGCRGAEHGQACTKERTGAVAVRAALESAVQVRRGNEGNRQAEMANPTKSVANPYITATAFPSPSPPCRFCAHLTIHHSLS